MMDIRTEVPRDEVINFIASLGMDPEDVRNNVTSVMINPGYITITQYRHDNGRLVHDNGMIMTCETMIAIK
jgi:hypothetical protein